MLNRNMFDILFLAETKIDSTVSSHLVSHPGFRTIRKDRKKGAGGLLVYIRNDLSAYRRLKLESSDIESICLDVKDSNKSRFIVCACYRSPTKGLFTWSGGPRSGGVGFFFFHALGDTKQKKPTPLKRGPPLHVNRV